MSTNLQDITLQSADGVLVATNDAGHLVYPMLHLNRQPTPEDTRGWDRVLVFVDGDGSLRVSPATIELNEENNYFQSLYIEAEGKWSISGVIAEYIQLDSSSGQLEGVGNVKPFYADRPFLFAIIKNNTILFLGRYVKPDTEKPFVDPGLDGEGGTFG